MRTMSWSFTILVLLSLLNSSISAIALLSRQRIYSEFRDIADQGLTLDIPFNMSSNECGIRLSPMKKNVLDWHFSFTGVEGSPYEGGVYHGTISLDSKYPRKAPVIRMSTPSGRWKVNEDICLSASAHHPELWDPSWNLRTLVLSLRGFMTTQPNEIGGTRTTSVEKEFLCEQSKNYVCPTCHIPHRALLPNESSGRATGFSLQNSRLLLSGTRLIAPTGRSAAPLSSAAKHATRKISTRAAKSKKRKSIKTGYSIFKPLKSRQVHNLMRFAVVLSGSMLLRGLIESVLRLLLEAIAGQQS